MAWDRCNQDSVWRELEVRTYFSRAGTLFSFSFSFEETETERSKRPRLASVVVPRYVKSTALVRCTEDTDALNAREYTGL